jgi:hypothetical protein
MIPDATLANETADLLNRATQDELKLKLQERFDTMSAARDALNDLTVEFVESKLREGSLDPVELAPFYAALEEHTGPGRDAELTAAKSKLRELRVTISLARADPERQALKMAERKSLLETMLPKMRSLMEATLRKETTRLDKYEAALRDSTDAFEDNPSEFWSKSTKEKSLSQIEKVAGPELRRKLDDALSGGDLSRKIKDWTETLGNTKADPLVMQSRASEVLTTADGYLQRIESVLKDAEITEAVRQLKGKLVSALTAIKLSTAEKLAAQFKAGRFKK